MKTNSLIGIILAGASPRGLIAILLAGVVQLLCGCSTVPRETIHCWDENNKPVEGVLVICQYSSSTLMTYLSNGADYRFSDAKGIATFSGDDPAWKLDPDARTRRVAFTYSPRLRSGGLGRGGYEQGERFPANTAYQKEGNENIYYRNNTNDPAIWFGVLYSLTEEFHLIRKRTSGYDSGFGRTAVGVDRLEAMLAPLVENEWDRFFKQYGSTPIPIDYFNQRFRYEINAIAKQISGPIKFHDLKQMVNDAK